MYRHRLMPLIKAARFPIFEYGNDHLMITPLIIGELRELSYTQQWQMAVERRWFHLKMEDHSIFIFNDNSSGPSYSYLPAPFEIESLRDFLTSKELEYNSRNIHHYSEEYQLVLETAQARAHVHPIRFDFDKTGYRPAIHPIAHIHIGLENDIRIALSRQMSPESFLLFVMRHAYPASWVRLMSQMTAGKIHRVIRASLQSLPHECWTESDQLELHLV